MRFKSMESCEGKTYVTIANVIQFRNELR